MEDIVLVDFGSTFTKTVVVSVPDRAVVFTTKVPSTVSTDATICLDQCLEEVRAQIGSRRLDQATTLASSSAAGGLRMAVCGLTPSLSVAAGRNVSFGAGAKVVHVATGALDENDIAEIVAKRTEIVLLCGGYENGNEGTLLHNAEVLAHSRLPCPVIFAGNSKVAGRVKQVMMPAAAECYLVANVMPEIGVFDAAQAEATVRNLFMQRIVDMKGLGKVRARLGEILMPTPAAVLSAGELLARGTEQVPGLGDLLILDIGGATTDIHSYATHRVKPGARSTGSAEPYAKRTVEGDLGMRESSDTLCREVGYPKIALAAQMTTDQVQQAVTSRLRQIDYLPDSDQGIYFDQTLARYAAQLASRRHAGRVERVVSINGRLIQRGKNLTEVGTVIGTGGVIVNSPNPEAVLRAVLRDPNSEPEVLLPVEASLYVDSDYVLFAVGLLREIDDNLALDVMKSCMPGW